jgi:hypothetical protein
MAEGLRQASIHLCGTACVTTSVRAILIQMSNSYSLPSSSGSTGRSSIPETLEREPRGRGVLDRPHALATTTECTFAISRLMKPEVCISFRPLENRGRREDRVRAAPAVSCAKRTKRNAHEHTGSAEASRPSLRSGFTAYFALSPVNGSFATVAPEKLAPQELDASTAAPGPHDFAVRHERLRLAPPSRPPHPTARP